MQNDKEEGEEWSFNEGCLSIPDVREDVYRNPTITIEYCEGFCNENRGFDGLIARVIQHGTIISKNFIYR
jgi:peptide deformylase